MHKVCFSKSTASMCSSAIRTLMAILASLRRCHLIQASLRNGDSKEYVIPRGFMFDYITCANYTAEIGAWLAFSAATQTLAAFMFAAAGTCQMVPWAMQKQKRLKKVRNKRSAIVSMSKFVLCPLPTSLLGESRQLPNSFLATYNLCRLAMTIIMSWQMVVFLEVFVVDLCLQHHSAQQTAMTSILLCDPHTLPAQLPSSACTS